MLTPLGAMTRELVQDQQGVEQVDVHGPPVDACTGETPALARGT